VINSDTFDRLSKTATLTDYVGLKVGSASYNTEGNRVLFILEGEARIWNMHTNVIELACIGTQAAFLPGTNDPALLVLNPASSGVLNLEICDTKHVTPLTNSVRSPVTAFTFDAAHGRVATAHQDGLIRLWKVNNGVLEDKPTCQFAATVGGVATLSFGSDGKWLAGTSSRLTRQVNVWDASACKPVVSFTFTSTVTALAVNGAASQLLVGQESGAINIIDIESGKTNVILKGGNQAVSALVFTPNGNSLFSANLDKTLTLWGNDGTPSTRQVEGALVSLSFSQNGKQAVFVSTTGEMQVWGLQ
jgi:WD40 repeat protein